MAGKKSGGKRSQAGETKQHCRPSQEAGDDLYVRPCVDISLSQHVSCRPSVHANHQTSDVWFFGRPPAGALSTRRSKLVDKRPAQVGGWRAGMLHGQMAGGRPARGNNGSRQGTDKTVALLPCVTRPSNLWPARFPITGEEMLASKRAHLPRLFHTASRAGPKTTQANGWIPTRGIRRHIHRAVSATQRASTRPNGWGIREH